MIVYVTRDHLKRGSQNSPSHCPLALALKEAFPGYEVHVQIKRMQFFKNKKLVYSTRLTHDLATFIDNFDYGFKTQPFSFRFCEETAGGLSKSNVVDHLRGDRQTL